MLRTLNVLAAVNVAAAPRSAASTASDLRLLWTVLDGRLTAAWISTVDVARSTAA